MEENRYNAILRRLRQNGNTLEEIGNALGVSAQSVGAWTNGKARPSKNSERKLEALASGKNVGIGAIGRDVKNLPLCELTDEKFEEFCVDFVKLALGYGHPHRFGINGDKQGGIDILCEKEQVVVQCKQTKRMKYNKSDAQKVIRALDATYWGDKVKEKILMVTALVPARTEKLLSDNNWTVYDLRRITSEVGQLKRENIIKLLKKYFVSYQSILKDCFEIDYGGHLILADDYFKNIDEKKGVFRHDGEYVTQSDKLLRNIFNELNDGRIVVIYGQGGCGKTRTIKELLRYDNSSTFYILANGDPLEAKELEELGDNDVLVIDDAHDNLSSVSTAVRVRDDRTSAAEKFKLIVITRTFCLDIVRNLLVSRQQENYAQHEISPLTVEEAEKLIDGIDKNIAYREGLIDSAKGNALILSVGTRAISEERLTPKQIMRSDFSRRVLGSYFDSLLDKTTWNSEKKKKIRQVLELISILQPITSQDRFIDAYKQFYEEGNPREINDNIATLRNGGILSRAKRNIKIIPDLYGEYLCEKFLGKDIEDVVEELMRKVNNLWFANIINNVGKLEWQSDKKDYLQVREIVRNICFNMYAREENKAALLGRFQELAYYQPDTATKLASCILRTTENNDQGAEIAGKLSKMLFYSAHNEEFLEKSLCLLLEIAKKFPATTKELDTENPAKAILKLIKYEYDKPFWYTEKVLDFITKNAQNGNLPFSEFELLDECLKTRGDTTISYANRMDIHSFLINEKYAKSIRRKCFDEVFRTISTSNMKESYKAADSLIEALKGMLWENGWDEGKSEVSSRIEEYLKHGFISKTMAAYIYAELYEGIERNQEFQKTFGIVKNDLDFNLPLALIEKYHHLFLWRTKIDESQYRKWLSDVIEMTKTEYGSDYKCLIEKIVSILKELKNSSIKGEESGYILLKTLVSEDESCEVADFLSGYILAHPDLDDYLSFCVEICLDVFAKKDNSKLTKFIDDVVKSGRDPLHASLARATGMFSDKLSDAQIREIFYSLYNDGGKKTKLTIIDSLLRIKEERPIIGEFARTVIDNENPREINVLLRGFCRNGGNLNLSMLDGANIDSIFRSQLREKRLDNSVMIFTQELAKICPEKVFEFFRNRLDYRSNHFKDWSYDAVPFNEKVEIPEESKETIFAMFLDWLHEVDGKSIVWSRADDLLKFLNFGEDFIINKIKALAEIPTGSDADYPVRVLVRSLNYDVIWRRGDDIREILSLCESSHGEEKVDKTIDAFVTIFIETNRMRSVGSPCSIDVEARDRSIEAVTGLSYNDPMYRLYEEIKNIAESEISRAKREDTEATEIFS